MDVCCRLFDRTDGRVRNQIRSEVVVACRERTRLGGREPEADVAIGADHDHAARRDAGADGINAGIVSDLHERGPASAQPRERRMETPPLDERRLFFGMVHEHRVPEFLCHEWPLFWQPESTDKPAMWQSGLAGVVLSMQSAYYGANCVRLTAADVQKWYQILSIGGLSVRLRMPLKCALGATEIVTPKKVPTFSQGGAAV